MASWRVGDEVVLRFSEGDGFAYRVTADILVAHASGASRDDGARVAEQLVPLAEIAARSTGMQVRPPIGWVLLTMRST